MWDKEEIEPGGGGIIFINTGPISLMLSQVTKLHTSDSDAHVAQEWCAAHLPNCLHLSSLPPAL